MFKFETADQKEVRRFRVAQFNGRTATVRAGGSTVTGHVRSVLERARQAFRNAGPLRSSRAHPSRTSRAPAHPACIHSWKISTEPARALSAPRGPFIGRYTFIPENSGRSGERPGWARAFSAPRDAESRRVLERSLYPAPDAGRIALRVKNATGK